LLKSFVEILLEPATPVGEKTRPPTARLRRELIPGDRNAPFGFTESRR
jgi:hypothetical protein